MADSLIDKSEEKVGSRREFVGTMMGSAKIVGDIVSPIIDMDEIEALWESDYANGLDRGI